MACSPSGTTRTRLVMPQRLKAIWTRLASSEQSSTSKITFSFMPALIQLLPGTRRHTIETPEPWQRLTSILLILPLYHTTEQNEGKLYLSYKPAVGLRMLKVIP